MKKKFYFANLDERNGEITYTHTICFTTAGSPDRYLDQLARNYIPKL